MPQSLVSAVLVTRRPCFVTEILGMMAAQSYSPLEVVLVLHGHTSDDLPPEAREACGRQGVRLVLAPAELTLGECLNQGIAVSHGEVVTKVDDDDIYGPGYLAEAMEAFITGKGDVIGKAEQYVYLTATRELLLRLPGWSQDKDHRYVAGGTLLMPRRLALDPGFEPIPCRVDTSFLHACLAVGVRIYATSRRHFVRRRFDNDHHTWRPDEALFRSEGVTVRRNVVDDSPAGLIRLVSGR
jgi:glycosyltransferase involved in cell wall biosynthesis